MRIEITITLTREEWDEILWWPIHGDERYATGDSPAVEKARRQLEAAAELPPSEGEDAA